VPSVYDFKPKFQALLRPLMKRLVSVGFTPNAVTLLALIGSVVVGGLLLQARGTPSLLLLLPVWLFARMALNAIDGMMAREHQMATPSGAVLNELGDVVSDLALYLPLAAVEEQSRWLVVGFCIGAILTEFCGVLGRAIGASRHYEGPMGKSDRAFWIGALAVVTVAAPKTYAFWPWIFGVGSTLIAVTCVNRLMKILAELKR
jgi:CDP-diacylglycerol---glycerol-3-phosphate 3-phosphatidyltransferase